MGGVLLLALLPTSLWAAESARVEVILVEARNGSSETDPSLSRYGATLQRLFKFDSYRKVSSNRMNLMIPGKGSAKLGEKGGSLTIEADAIQENSIRADLNWKRGQKRLLHTKLQLRKGTPAVLGGPRSDSGSYLLLIVWK